MKSKYIAAALAFVFGIFGLHRFYLGQRFLGTLYFLSFFIGLMLQNTPLNGGEFPFLIVLPALLGFIDSILLAVMPTEDFDARYNKKRVKQKLGLEDFHRHRIEDTASIRAGVPLPLPEIPSEYKRRGIERFRDCDFEGAITEFKMVLENNFDDPATHFNLACCYSITEKAKDAYYHLSQAVRFGFHNFEKIKNHDALAFLRTQPDYDAYVKNNYTFSKPTQSTVETKSTEKKEESLVLRDDLLDQIIQLGELRNKGVLTEEEFAKQKEKVLAQR